MSGLRPITCIHCSRERPAGREPCPHCGGQPLAHKQTPEEFRERIARQLDQPWDDPARTGARVSQEGGVRLIDDGRRGYVFGVWNAPATDEDIPIPAPVGKVCAWCQEEIKEDDNGRISAVGHVEHRECCLRNVLGGIGHLVDHQRYCHGALGTDAGLSRRQSSLLAWEYFQRTRLAPTDEQRADWRAHLEEVADG